MEFKYMRVQGRKLSFVTKRPKGIFAMCWRMIYEDDFQIAVRIE